MVVASQIAKETQNEQKSEKQLKKIINPTQSSNKNVLILNVVHSFFFNTTTQIESDQNQVILVGKVQPVVYLGYLMTEERRTLETYGIW